MEIKIDKSDIKRMTEKFTDIEKKELPYSTMTTLNNVAFEVMNKQKQIVSDELNWRVKVPNVLRVKKATKQNLEAEVFVDKSSWGYYALKQHFISGDRSIKGLETWLKNNGFLNENQFLSKSSINQVKKSVSKMIIKDFESKNFSRFFIITNSKSGKNGIYAKVTDVQKVTILFKIIKKPTYKKRFDLKDTVNEVWSKNGEKIFNEAIQKAISTAK